MSEGTYKWNILKASMKGELLFDDLARTLYATDASIYRELPDAVAYPKDAEDVKQLIHFATKEKTSLIPRTAGTSLAGQCVGKGIVVDTSRYFNQILEVNVAEKWVRVQPGVVRDELNHFLKPYGLFFGPNTSTANRAMVGGMVGNNSCGSYSIVYGTTRDHVMELHCVLSDGSDVVFSELSGVEFEEKCKLDTLEGVLYRQIQKELNEEDIRKEILQHFPPSTLHRRNTGYAVDELMNSQAFIASGAKFNFCRLLAGSEGTLAITTEIKLHVDPLPPKETGMMCVHFDSILSSLKATVLIMEHKPRAVELMDKIVLDCTKGQRLYEKSRFFLQGDPGAILMVEMGGNSRAEVDERLSRIEQTLTQAGMGYAYPRLYAEDMSKAWKLREAGLGLLSNIPGDAKPVAFVEDTAVDISVLPEYIDAFDHMMRQFGQRAVYYAHAGAGEIHLRPILNLKKTEDRIQLREIGLASAKLVKQYNGSLSGEHGDGRVRAEFIPLMVGEKNYELFKRIKYTWDPANIFNPGKIVDAPPMNTQLRYEAEQKTRHFQTIFDFSDTDGILRAVEKCNGSGDCRKSHLAGGTMCPSYQATRDEKDTTRGRANVLREFLTHSNKDNPFAHEEIYEVMDLCLSCKGCTSECPSNVDMTVLKAEFLHQYYKTKGVPFRVKAFANVAKIHKWAALAPGVFNFLQSSKLTGGLGKRLLGVAPERELPKLHGVTLRKWFADNAQEYKPKFPKGKVYFFADEFTNYLDTEIGMKAIQLLNKLGYEVEIPDHDESGRAQLSKGLLREARRIAMYNLNVFDRLIGEETPLIGVEPSTILSFRDEYPKLVIPEYKEAALSLAKNSLLIDEFLVNELQKGKIDSTLFHKESLNIKLHGHCHQKALSSVQHTQRILSLPENYTVEIIPSGCCGMAGSFGYEREHYELSMKIGELVLFPSVRNSDPTTRIVAPGTSCRHQIFDGTGRVALHPIEILWEALNLEHRA